MKILFMQKADNPPSTVKAFFGWEFNGIQYHGWKIVEGKNTDAIWVCTPRIRIFPGAGLSPIDLLTVRIPKDLSLELQELALAEYEKLKGE